MYDLILICNTRLSVLRACDHKYLNSATVFIPGGGGRRLAGGCTALRKVQWGRQDSSLGQQAVLALLNSKLKGLRHPSCAGNTCVSSAGVTRAEDPCGSGKEADISGGE